MESWFPNAQLYHLAIGAAIVVAFWFLTTPVRHLLLLVGRRIFAKTETELDDRLLAVALANIRPLMVTLGLRIAVREFRKGTGSGEVTQLQILDYAEALLYLAIAVLLVRILLGILRELIHWHLDRISADGASNLKQTLGPLTTRLTNLLVGLIGVIIILDHFEINIGSLLVSLGVGSLAVALAAQDTLANMIAGFVILVDRPFRVGDRIEIIGGPTGDVLEIGLRSTKVVTFENNALIIPNSDLVKSRITNYTVPAPAMRVLLRFDIAYGSDLSPAKEILLSAARSHPHVLADPAPEVFVTAMTESAVQLTLVARASAYTLQFGAETAIRERVYAEFLRQGIAVAVPRRVVHLEHPPAPAG
jgi:MscS family membrane protein